MATETANTATHAVSDGMACRESTGRRTLWPAVDSQCDDARIASLYGTAAKPVARTPVTTDACPACGSVIADRLFEVEEGSGDIVVCACGLGRLWPLPSPEELEQFYPPAYYGQSGGKFSPLLESAVRLLASRRVRYLARGLPQGARILDVGCGRGVGLGQLADRGLRVCGFDISTEAVEGCDERAEIKVASNLQQAEFPAESFDRIVIWHVLEHVSDPDELLKETHRLLRPGGSVIVAIPNFSSWQASWAGADWFHLDLPRHLYHFPVPVVRRMLTNAGFRCRAEHHFSLQQNAFGWVQSILNRTGWFTRNSLYASLQRRAKRRPSIPAILALLLLTPLALALAVLETCFQKGATVHVQAVRSGLNSLDSRGRS